MAHTKNGIMAQIWVAFGQGTGFTRVSQDACLHLYALYYDAIRDELVQSWEEEAPQVLERIRAIGKLAASKAIDAGATAISIDDVRASAAAVHRGSDTAWCPPA
jgi:hypothetical protein